MEIQHKTRGDEGMFYIEEGGHVAGRMTYVRDGGSHITIEHTIVGDELKGRGAGKKLMTATINWARENGLRVSATCSFAQSLFEKVPEYQDVWDREN